MEEYTCIFYKTNIFPWLCKEDTENSSKRDRDCQRKKERFFSEAQEGGLNNEKS